MQGCPPPAGSENLPSSQLILALGAIVTVLAGLVVSAFICLFFREGVCGFVHLWKTRTQVFWRKKREQQKETKARTGGQATKRVMLKEYSAREIRSMTNNFDERLIVGKGTTGIVYRGRLESGRLCAVKCLTRPPENGPESIRRFEKEVFALSKLRHRNLVRLQGYCTEEGNWIQVLAFIKEGSLWDRLRGGGSQSRAPLTLEERVSILIGIADALHHLHSRNLIHRDVKPSNVLLGNGSQAKLTDFGMIREVGGSARSTFSQVAGTPGYVDPDNASRSKVTKASDIYGLGIVMLEVWTGREVEVKGEGDLATALQYKDTDTTQNPLISEVLLISSAISPRSRRAPEIEPAVDSLHVKDWVCLMMAGKEWCRLMDPGLALTEHFFVCERPEAAEAEVEKRLLEAFYNLAISCLQPTPRRPPAKRVSLELSLLLEKWLSFRESLEKRKP